MFDWETKVRYIGKVNQFKDVTNPNQDPSIQRLGTQLGRGADLFDVGHWGPTATDGTCRSGGPYVGNGGRISNNSAV